MSSGLLQGLPPPPPPPPLAVCRGTRARVNIGHFRYLALQTSWQSPAARAQPTPRARAAGGDSRPKHWGKTGRSVGKPQRTRALKTPRPASSVVKPPEAQYGAAMRRIAASTPARGSRPRSSCAVGRGHASLSASLDTWRSEHPHTAGCLGRPTARSARARARGRRLADPPENLRRQSQAATHDRLDAARVHAGCAQAAHHVAGGVQLALQALRVALGASIRRAGVRRPPPRPPAAAQRSATAALWFNPIDANPLGFAPIGRYCWWLPRRGGRGGARWPRVRRRRASGRPRPPSRPAPARASRPAAAAATVYPDVRQFTLSESRPRGASPSRGGARDARGERGA